MRPNGTRTKKSGIEPGGFRWAAYEVDGDKLKAGETYTLHMKLIAQAEPAFFIDVQSSAGVGLDYNFSLRELTKRVVDVSIDIWEQTQSVTIKQEGGV
jgi:hypothetical protein